MDIRVHGLIAGSLIGAAFALMLFAEPSALPQAQTFAECGAAPDSPQVLARAAYVYSIADQEALFEKNADAQLPLASVTKVMTVLAALDTLAFDDVVTITPEALTPEGESGFRIGDTMKAGELAAFTLIESSNDGARALLLASAEKQHMSEADFIDGMNKRARGIGLSQTYYMNETGLDISGTVAGAYGSARDAALLMAFLAEERPAVVEHSVEPERRLKLKNGGQLLARNTALIGSAFGATIGSKTGFTDLAGGNLAFVFEPIPGKPVSVVVLGSTREAREADAERLARFASETLRKQGACTW
jgi:serine-type D-Ala-D-Ala carboxypeptidase (penicillin-binding protein 5/6)